MEFEGMTHAGRIRSGNFIPWYISLRTGEYEYMKHETAKK